ncbi:MAG: NADH-quinone oxidoreductase subunit NuoF [Planctomycetes bacterium]|nr:NADH-quinone oxidoreductase subunit NuoF [Planctomycetota bacterium]
MVNDTYCENLTTDAVDRILDDPERAGELWIPNEANYIRRWKTEDTLIVTRRFNNPDPVSLALYERDGGNAAWRKVLEEMKPDEVTEVVKQSGLVGRGGAGFSAGLKWSFIDRKSKEPHYLTVNADEGEPGTFKDRYLMEQDPHMFLEGASICSYAIGAHTAYVYIRGEFGKAQEIVQKAIDARTAAGLLGKNILGSGFDLDIHVHTGAGAYICGEETGLLESLEGKRGQPRSKPPFPAVIGLFQGPTIINNVETLANVPDIIVKGAAWFASIGVPKNTGTRMLTVSGHVMKPGYYELPLGIPLRTLIYDVCGGLRPGRQLAAVIPGGASSGWLLPSEIDVPMDFNSLRAAGSMAGSGAVMVIDDSVCLLKVLLRIEEFFQDESCGQCTPCREGTGWLARVLHKIEHGEGTKADIDLAFSIANNMAGITICVLSDAAAMPMQAVIKKFRPVLEAHVEHRGCPQTH